MTNESNRNARFCEVSTAYRTFLRSTRPIVVICISFFAAIATAAIATKLSPTGHLGADSTIATRSFDMLTIALSWAFGWRTRAVWMPVLRGSVNVPIAFTYVLAGVALMMFASIVQGTLDPQAAERAARMAPPPFILAAFIAPIAETLLFQGWIQTAVEQSFGSRVAFAVAAVAFWAVHLRVDAPLIVTVVVLCGIRARTRSLGTVALAHVCMNLAMFALVFATPQV